MKQRLGFVSNSSSSSFIIAFDEDPVNLANLRIDLPDVEDDVLGAFHTAIVRHGPATEESLREKLYMIVNSNRGEQFYKTSDYFSDDPDTMYCFAKKSELTQNKTEELLPKLVKLSTTKYVYALTILDDTPETDKICHGGVITNLKGIRN